MKCPCEKIRKKLVCYRSDADLPPDLRATLNACPECRLFWSETRRVAALMALKQYERPAPQVAVRCRAAVRAQLEAAQAERAAAWWDFPLPAFRFGLAAVLLVILGLHMVSTAPIAPFSLPEQAWVEPPQKTAEAVLYAEEDRANPDFNNWMQSNFMPRVQHRSAYQFVGFER